MSPSRLLLITLWLTLAWLPSHGAGAAEYVVNPAYPRSADGPARGRAEPFRTITGALAQAGPGDTVAIAPGAYREEIKFPRGGAASRPLVLKALPGGQVQIKGSDLVTGWVHHSGAVWKRTGWTVNSQQVFADGVPLQQIGAGCPFAGRAYQGKTLLPPVGRGLHDLKEGSFFYDQAGQTLYVQLTDGSDPNGHTMEAAVRDWIISSEQSFVHLHQLHFSHSNHTAKGVNRALVNILGKHWVVSRCSFTYGDFAGLALAGEGHRVIQNVANRNGALGINVNGSDAAHQWKRYPDRPSQDLRVEGNETNFNNYRGFNFHWHAGGFRAATSGTGIVVSQHQACGNMGVGIWFDGWCQDISINRCTVKDNRGSGIFYEISDRAVISNNLVVGNKQQGIYVAASDQVKVVNNTLDRNWAGIVLHGVPRREHPTLRNNLVSNNLLGDHTWADLVVYVGPAGAGDNTMDFNWYFRPGGGVRIAWTTTSSYTVNFTDLAAFSQATGQERHGSCGDPAWVGRQAGNYALSGKSPVIDAGDQSMAGVAGDLDLLGKRRVAPGPGKQQPIIDRGACEYQ